MNFRILMRAHRPPEAWIDKQFTWSRNRLREPLSEHDPVDGLVTQSTGDADNDQGDTDDRPKDVDDLI